MTKKNIALAVILSLITCGIYSIYWFITISDDLNTLCKDNKQSGGVAFLLSLITCGIYGIYFVYMWGDRIDNYLMAQGKKREGNSIIYLLLSLLGFTLIAQALCQEQINKAIDSQIIS